MTCRSVVAVLSVIVSSWSVSPELRAAPRGTPCAAAAPITVAAPGGRLAASVFCDREGHLAWSARWDGQSLASGQLGLDLFARPVGDLGRDPLFIVAQVEPGGASFPVVGAHATADVRWNELRLALRSDGLDWHLEMRASDHGLAFRYSLGSGEPVGIVGESTSWIFGSGATLWASPRDPGDAYEATYQQHPIATLPAGRWAEPLLVANAAGPWLALAEADHFGWSGATLVSGPPGSRRLGVSLLEAVVYPFSVHRPARSPWRVMLIADDLDGLVNNDLVAALNPPPESGRDFSWVEPGLSFYSYWTLGAFDGSDESQAAAERIVREGAALGLAYVTIDAGWWDLQDLPGVCRLAADLGVKLFVWLDRSGASDEMLDLLRAEPLGFTGIKVDFFERYDWGRLLGDDQANLRAQAAIARRAADRQMLVLFHGVPRSAGAERTWPNIVGWEGVRGLENNLWVNYLAPAHYTIVPFVRALAGPYDFTPVGLDATRRHGTTVAQQLATGVVLSSPTTQLAEDPGVLLASRAGDLIGELPSVWDETRVLAPSAPGDLAAFARRHGDVWWLGVVSGRSTARRVELALDFLTAPATATVISDATRGAVEDFDSLHAIPGDDSRRWVVGVGPGSRLRLDLAPGGGALVRIVPSGADVAGASGAR